ncbi:MAG: glycoside hydrolase family 43 protein, partial [Bacteroidota bacterium]
FPVFENGLIPISPKLKMPPGAENNTGQKGFFPNGNFTFKDDFTAEKLDYRWISLRGFREEFTEITDEGLKIHPFATHIKEIEPTSTLFLRQQHNSFSFTTTLDYRPASEKDLAGVVALQNEGSNFVFGITKKGEDTYLVLEKNRWPGRNGDIISETIASTKIDLSAPIKLKISANGDAYEFSYATKGKEFENLGGIISGDILSTDIAGGFTGCLLGLYATTANDIQP